MEINEGIAFLKNSKKISSLLNKAYSKMSKVEDMNTKIRLGKITVRLKEAKEDFEKIENLFNSEPDPIRKIEIKNKFKKLKEKYKDVIEQINKDRAIKALIGATVVASLVALFFVGKEVAHVIHDQNLEAIRVAEEKNLVATVSKMYGHNKEELAKEIIKIANAEGVPPKIAVAMVSLESEWKATAYHKNEKDGSVDRGLCQLNSKYLNDFVKSYWDSKEKFNVLDPEDNATVAFRHLKWLFSKTNDWRKAVMAYNGGLGSVSDDDSISKKLHRYANIVMGPEGSSA